MVHVNARAIIERKTDDGVEIIIQTRNKPGEAKSLELPGGRIEEFESLRSTRWCRRWNGFSERLVRSLY